MEVVLDVGAGGGEERAEDAALGKIDDGVDAGEAFGPCAAQEFAEDGFSLVAKGVGGGYGVEMALGHELAKPLVTEAAGGFFDGLVLLAGFVVQRGFVLLACFGGGVNLMRVEGEVEGLGQLSGELLVSVRCLIAEPVMEMSQVEDET